MQLTDFTVELGGKPWRVEFTTRRQMPRRTWGDCNWNLSRIRVRRDLSPQHVIDTLIHEMRHAQHVVLFEAEEFVNSTSTEIAVGLIRSGAIKG